MKGMCYIEPLFHKVVKREKTQTRRMITPEPIIKNDWFIKEIEGWKKAPFGVVLKYPDCEPERFEIMQLLRPKYNVGEIVYLKEPYVRYQETYQELMTNASGLEIAYKYGNNLSIENITGNPELKWGNKLFMPEKYARYFIKITDRRPERLQDISDEDCIREGIESFTKDNQVFKYGLEGWVWYDMPRSPREAYAALINKIHGKGAW